MKENQHTQNKEVHTNLFIMRRVLTKMMQGRENYILNLEGANVISNQD